jgi:2-iminobutanoate/2-iminopropanoate deaminase
MTAAKSAVATKEAPAAIGPYSQGIAAGNLVFVSGQIPLAADGEPVPGGIPEQTERCLKNLAAVLSAAGLSLADVVKTTVFMTDLSLFAAMNEVYARHFSAPFPARAAVQVAALPKGAGVEIEAVAVRP